MASFRTDSKADSILSSVTSTADVGKALEQVWTDIQNGDNPGADVRHFTQLFFAGLVGFAGNDVAIALAPETGGTSLIARGAITAAGSAVGLAFGDFVGSAIEQALHHN